MNILLLGEGCALLDLGSEADLGLQRRLWALARTLRAEPQWTEVVPGMNNLALCFDPLQVQAEQAVQRLSQGWRAAKPLAATQRHELRIPVRYGGADGPDLDAAAALCKLTPRALVEAHAGARYTVFFLGFQPGFAYLGGLPEALRCPRRAEPRLQVPAGSVAIAAGQTAVYPLASPGGWQLIGRTDLRLFDPAREPACLLQPGDTVRFVAHD